MDYSEFIAACLESHNYMKESHLRQAFSYFDKDNSGTISRNELRTCLQGEDFLLSEEEINNLLKDVDQDGDGEVDYDEFIDMMREQSKPTKKWNEIKIKSTTANFTGTIPLIIQTQPDKVCLKLI